MSQIKHKKETHKYRVLEEKNIRGYSNFFAEKNILGLFWFPMNLIAFSALNDAWDFIDKKYKQKSIKHYR